MALLSCRWDAAAVSVWAVQRASQAPNECTRSGCAHHRGGLMVPSGLGRLDCQACICLAVSGAATLESGG